MARITIQFNRSLTDRITRPNEITFDKVEYYNGPAGVHVYFVDGGETLYPWHAIACLKVLRR